MLAWARFVSMAVFSLAACSIEKETTMHRVTFWISSGKAAVPGATIYFGRQEIGASNGRGMLRLDVPGTDGQRFPIFAQCPAGFRPAEGARTLQLVRFASDHPRHREFGVEMKIECPPVERLAAVIVKAGKLANVPVMRNGREVGRTDASGVAHIGFRAKPGERFKFVLDTSARRYRRVRPANPESRLYKMPDRNELFVWDVDFDYPRDPPPIVVPGAGPRKPCLPTEVRRGQVPCRERVRAPSRLQS